MRVLNKELNSIIKTYTWKVEYNGNFYDFIVEEFYDAIADDTILRLNRVYSEGAEFSPIEEVEEGVTFEDVFNKYVNKRCE